MTGRTNTNERSNTKTPKRREDNFTIAHLNARSVLPRTGTTSPSSRTLSLRISLTSLPLARLGWILRSKSRVIPSLVLIVQTKLGAACVPLWKIISWPKDLAICHWSLNLAFTYHGSKSRQETAIHSWYARLIGLLPRLQTSFIRILVMLFLLCHQINLFLS